MVRKIWGEGIKGQWQEQGAVDGASNVTLKSGDEQGCSSYLQNLMTY